jgi:hypothetical protein
MYIVGVLIHHHRDRGVAVARHLSRWIEIPLATIKEAMENLFPMLWGSFLPLTPAF